MDFISNKSREVVLLNSDEFSVRGKRNFQKPDGSFCRKVLYERMDRNTHINKKKMQKEMTREFMNKAYRPT